MLNLLSPREVADVDQAVNTFLQLNKYTEVGEVANLCIVLAANRILGLDSLPGILAELLDTESLELDPYYFLSAQRSPCLGEPLLKVRDRRF